MKLGEYPLRSPRSRAAARALALARQESDGEGEWDKPLDCTGLAEALAAARERAEHEGASQRNEPIHIPPGRENTVRGRLAARINAARERVAI
jgi:hypothetical protein